ncbi:MAG: endonuclease MutS2, partial [Bacillota bacterium]
MNQYSIEVLELDKIISSLEYYASTIPGKEIINNLKPVNDYDYIEARLNEVTQAKDMINNFGTPPFGGIKDLRDILKKVNKEMVLSTEEIVKVQNSLAGFKNLKKYFQNIMEKEDPGVINNRYDILVNKGLKIKLLSDLEREIEKCIDEYGNIKDSASPKLQSIRDSIQGTENKIREKLQNIIRGTRYQSMLQDSLITKRENRYVVPVKHEYRNTFNGIVHDRSASGMTIFMEPMAIVKLNNKLREIKNEEEAEIYRILQQLSYKIAEAGTIIKENLKISSILDVDFARGEYSCEIRGTAPALNHKGRIGIKKGRHPLLQNEPVPIDVEVGGDFSSLVITGPNTGGKTVTLKTIGLFVLMTELGLHIPADYGSDIYLFRKVFADIGDE